MSGSVQWRCPDCARRVWQHYNCCPQCGAIKPAHPPEPKKPYPPIGKRDTNA